MADITRDIIDNIVLGKISDAADTIKSTLNDKLSTELDNYKKLVAADIFKDTINNKEEQ